MWRKSGERFAVGIDTKVVGPNPKRGAFFHENDFKTSQKQLILLPRLDKIHDREIKNINA